MRIVGLCRARTEEERYRLYDGHGHLYSPAHARSDGEEFGDTDVKSLSR